MAATGTSIKTGSSLSLPTVSRSSPSNSPGVVARAPRTPKLSANCTKSGLTQIGPQHPPFELFHLRAADIAVRAVVEDDRDQPDAVLARGR